MAALLLRGGGRAWKTYPRNVFINLFFGTTMGFQAYLDNIKAKTGMTPDDFLAAAKKKGMLKDGVTATEIMDYAPATTRSWRRPKSSAQTGSRSTRRRRT